MKSLMSDISCFELYYGILGYCTEVRSFEDAAAFADANLNRGKTLSGATLCIENLVKAGGLSRSVIVGADEVSYEAFIAMLEEEDVVKEDGRVMLQTTDAGRDVLKTHSPAKRLRQLLDEHAQYEGVFTAIMRYCESPRTLQDITVEIQRMGYSTQPAKGAEVLYPSFVIDNLQRAGIIVWDSGWQLTEGGRAIGVS